MFLMRYIPYHLRPKQDRKEDKTLHILVKDKSRDVINEAFRVIRTNLEFMAAPEEGGRVIMLTSFNPNSGKTFIACNLALSLAIKNKRVLVIDMDMRKTSLSALVNKPKEGLSLILGGYRTDYQSLIQTSTFNEQLQILPVGTIPPNPTELLYSPILGNMLSELRKQYDYIFLDCPPLEIVADATIVSPLADMSIFVIRAELLEREALPELEKYYEEARLKKMSIILNGTTDAFSRYGYHRYGSRYGYGYGHRYGYGYRYGYRYGYGDHYDDEETTETK
jgi:capsular exopolysaccharide synthesis family protein